MSSETSPRPPRTIESVSAFGAGLLASFVTGVIFLGLGWVLDGSIAFAPLVVGTAVGVAMRFTLGRAASRYLRIAACALTYFGSALTWMPGVAVELHERSAEPRVGRSRAAGEAESSALSASETPGATFTDLSNSAGLVIADMPRLPKPPRLPANQGASPAKRVAVEGRVFGTAMLFSLALAWPLRRDGILDLLLAILGCVVAWSLLGRGRDGRPEPRSAPAPGNDGSRGPSGG
jgi:hypothetical protein